MRVKWVFGWARFEINWVGTNLMRITTSDFIALNLLSRRCLSNIKSAFIKFLSFRNQESF